MILDIIIPLYNKEKSISNLYNKIEDDLIDIKHNYIFINNHSNDKTLDTLKKLYKKDKSNIKIIDLAKTCDKEKVIYTGLCYSKHKYVCIYDPDLQANVSYITKMYNYLLEHDDYDQVCMYANNKQKTKLKLFNRTFNLRIDTNKTFFRVMKRNVVKAIVRQCKNNKFSAYSFDLIGFRTYYIRFDNKNNDSDLLLNDYMCYIEKPSIIVYFLIGALILFTFIFTVFAVLGIISVSNKCIAILSCLLTIIILYSIYLLFEYISYKNYNNNDIIIRELIGLEEETI